MKQLLRFGLAASLYAGQAFAVNPACGWYAGLIGEVSYMPDINMTLNMPLISGSLPLIVYPAGVTPSFFPILPSRAVESTVNYRIMGGGGGQIGYRFTGNYRAEVEVIFNTNEYDYITVPGYGKIERGNSNNAKAGLSLNGRTNLMMGFLNGYYDFLSNDSEVYLVPYVGLGVGYVSVQNRLRFIFDDQPIPNTRYNSTKGTFAGQVIAGLSYYLDDFTSFHVDYRYIATNGVKENNLLFNTNERFQVHTLNVSLNFSFDSTWT